MDLVTKGSEVPHHWITNRSPQPTNNHRLAPLTISNHTNKLTDPREHAINAQRGLTNRLFKLGDFKLGDILSIPYAHTALDSNASANNGRKFVQGKDALVMSERHLAMAVHPYETRRVKVFILETHQGQGPCGKSEEIKQHTYMLRDTTPDPRFRNMVANEPIEVTMDDAKKPIGIHPSLDITNYHIVDMDEVISWVRKVKRADAERLLQAHNDAQAKADQDERTRQGLNDGKPTDLEGVKAEERKLQVARRRIKELNDERRDLVDENYDLRRNTRRLQDSMSRLERESEREIDQLRSRNDIYRDENDWHVLSVTVCRLERKMTRLGLGSVLGGVANADTHDTS
ncbi:hypothetical protein CLAFUW4_02675 [Fulvia fulva]|uniref:Uncharacterized protein n=1 Tax=Passalora fulva TaxID=5499 RepID=A0A9Q8LAD1_PASFU|nr:uncharacterized protein CLAFUR5_02665 [Fulvia fulva]KAK4631314.1 hypothetical protein CLAFUR4_02670 [Fulvia fulva]KAK4633747.1 hypothetical protein CLAFUR0_02672 [Fulvia fulva]UJO13851.1 hypothetical protein CLAFUR5_02665 [Fulvia fulva]WPV11654.1 hypothetical protein CLAFUW4_02675 [Fulvia fulva]WPV26238.1 hypothetical protein CLAFUW7_02674 [Fulvia fulva]